MDSETSSDSEYRGPAVDKSSLVSRVGKVITGQTRSKLYTLTSKKNHNAEIKGDRGFDSDDSEKRRKRNKLKKGPDWSDIAKYQQGIYWFSNLNDPYLRLEARKNMKFPLNLL